MAIRPYSRSSAAAWLRSWRTTVSSTQTPRVPRSAAGPCSRPAVSSATSATRPPAKASAMPWRAGHMPLSRNQPAAVSAWSRTSGTSRAYGPMAAPPARSRPSPAVSPAGCIPGAMIGDRPSALARWASVIRALPRVVGAL
ncbi:hypothetical protein AN221_01105 [Streptomyces nanshensis]|uniref:Uncharacterized protein n=1 Tax=Streptomyces nanshensis TaxID=518642 RepID=A0A1E7M1I3_9ACTN|nr:hypothetical protein AN221_01105 [Streptomyces nanshensis]